MQADGSAYSLDEVAVIFRQCLASPRAKASGVEVRFQNALLRFLPVLRELERIGHGVNLISYQLCLSP